MIAICLKMLVIYKNIFLNSELSLPNQQVQITSSNPGLTVKYIYHENFKKIPAHYRFIENAFLHKKGVTGYLLYRFAHIFCKSQDRRGQFFFKTFIFK